MSLVLNLITAGIRIVQLLPAEVIFDEKAGPFQVMLMIMELSRGHSESAMKSERVGGAWRNKKALAAETRTPITAKSPFWLRLEDGHWRVNQEQAESVRLIYRLAKEGWGIGAITKRLNDDAAPGIGRHGHWAKSTVNFILRQRAVLGEYQPCRRVGKKRVEDGQPIQGYYPALLSEEEWFATRASVAGRRGRPGRRAAGAVVLFASLLHDARDGGPIHTSHKGKTAPGHTLVPYRARLGIPGSKYVSFPLQPWETAVLALLREIDPSELLAGSAQAGAVVAGLEARLAHVQDEQEKVKRRLQATYSDAVADVLERHEQEAKGLRQLLRDAHQQAAVPLSGVWTEAQTLLAVLERDNSEPTRLRLRAALRRIIDGVWCLFVAKGRSKLAAVQIRFKDCDRPRNYLIRHNPGTSGCAGSRPAHTSACSFRSAGLEDDLDFRKSESVGRLEETLSGLS